jgi:hypothetical protein
MTKDNRKSLHQPSKVWINGVPVERNEQTPLHKPGNVSVSSERSSDTADVKVIKAIGKTDLERKMNKLIAQGYIPSGGPTVANTGKATLFMGEYTQVMIKP